jgi:multidrug transporter EmrE-like cation transporter
MSGFVMALLAALCFTVGGIFMKLSEGLTKLWPSVAIFVLFAVGATLNTLLVKRGGELGPAYTVIVGLESVLAFVFGVVFFGEDRSWPRLLGVALVLGGLLLLRR